MEAEQIYEVVRKLTGPIHPLGESSADRSRLENLNKFIQVFDKMHSDIDGIAMQENSSLHSIAKIGKRASEHIESMGIAD